MLSRSSLFGNISRPFQLAATCARRNASSATSNFSPVNLDYSKIVPHHGNDKDRPLIILHGLLWV